MAESFQLFPIRGILFVVFCLMAISLLLPPARAFSMEPKQNNNNLFELPSSRRDLLKSPLAIGGAIVYAKLVSDAVLKLTSRSDGVYPIAHERRVEEVLAQAALASIPPSSMTTNNNNPRPLRILEVGIGTQWRLNQRGLYQSALKQLSSKGVSQLELTGVDLSIPSADRIQDLSTQMNTNDNNQLHVDIHVQEQSITSRLDFPDGYFDSVVGSLVLCSVDDQDAALQEIKRLVRPNGGTFGYIEHVAVNPGEESKYLELQQKLLDPLQQALADNCHLRRFTEDNIATLFEIESSNSTKLFSERFIVKDMWPISCQCCGVVQRIA